MALDYKEIGRRIAQRRRDLKLKQITVSERAGISDKYLSNIERAISIPSTEVVMRLAAALDTTPVTFLVGTAPDPANQEWRVVAQRLRPMTPRQLELTAHFIDWVIREEV